MSSTVLSTGSIDVNKTHPIFQHWIKQTNVQPGIIGTVLDMGWNFHIKALIEPLF